MDSDTTDLFGVRANWNNFCNAVKDKIGYDHEVEQFWDTLDYVVIRSCYGLQATIQSTSGRCNITANLVLCPIKDSKQHRESSQDGQPAPKRVHTQHEEGHKRPSPGLDSTFAAEEEMDDDMEDDVAGIQSGYHPDNYCECRSRCVLTLYTM